MVDKYVYGIQLLSGLAFHSNSPEEGIIYINMLAKLIDQLEHDLSSNSPIPIPTSTSYSPNEAILAFNFKTLNLSKDEAKATADCVRDGLEILIQQYFVTESKKLVQSVTNALETSEESGTRSFTASLALAEEMLRQIEAPKLKEEITSCRQKLPCHGG